MSPEHIHKPSDMATAHHRQRTPCHTWTNWWLNWCCRRVTSARGPRGTFDPSCHTLANLYTRSTLQLVKPKPRNPFTSTAAQLAHTASYAGTTGFQVCTCTHRSLALCIVIGNCFPCSDPAVMINGCDQVIRQDKHPKPLIRDIHSIGYRFMSPSTTQWVNPMGFLV